MGSRPTVGPHRWTPGPTLLKTSWCPCKSGQGLASAALAPAQEVQGPGRLLNWFPDPDLDLGWKLGRRSTLSSQWQGAPTSGRVKRTGGCGVNGGDALATARRPQSEKAGRRAPCSRICLARAASTPGFVGPVAALLYMAAVTANAGGQQLAVVASSSFFQAK